MGVAVTVVASFLRFPIFDDAYITYRYARNAAAGVGFVYNVGERVEGYTTFLQTVVLIPFLKLGADPRYISIIIAILGVSLMAAWGYRRLLRDAGPDNHWPIAFWWSVVLGPPVVYWMLSGMETVWYATVVFAATLALESDLSRARVPWRAAALGVAAALLRPDGVVVAFALGVAWLVGARERRWRGAMTFAAIFGALYGAYFLWRYSYYSALMPNTYYAKVGTGGTDIRIRGLDYAVRNGMDGIFPVVLIWLIYRAKRVGAKMEGRTLRVLGVIGAQYFVATWTGGDYLPFFRFLLPVWPLVILACAEIAALRGPVGGNDGTTAPAAVTRVWLPRTRTRAMALFVVLCGLTTVMDANGLKAAISNSLTRSWELNGHTLAPILPKDSLIATTAIGAVGYILNRPLIDMMGLTDATIAHTEMPMGKHFPGHEKYNTAYVLSREPDIILLCFMTAPEPIQACPEGVEGFAQMPARVDMFKTPRFWDEYQFVNHPIHGGYAATFLRRDKVGTEGYEEWFSADSGPKYTEGS